MALTRIDRVSENDLVAECIDNCFAAAQACSGAREEYERRDAEHCQVCAEGLRDCAETCRGMAH